MAGDAPRKVSAVLFDLGGVLFSPPQTAIVEVEHEHGLPLGTLFRVFASGESDSAFCRLERGELTLSQFFPVFEKEVERETESRGIALPSESFSARQLFKRMASSVTPIPAMIRAVHTIREAGYKTGVITNNWIDDTNEGSNQLLTKFLNDHFDLLLQSCQLGIRKPNPLIFRLACHRLRILPSQAVFLDDLGVNVKAAREIGMTVVRVRETEKALTDLETLLTLKLMSEGEHDNRTTRTLLSLL